MGVWLGLASLAGAGGLMFPEVVKEFNAGLEDSRITVDFKFTNESGKTVKIVKHDACSCLTVQLAEGKSTYAPGESGAIRATFDTTNRTGAVEEGISVWLDDDPQDKPSQRLTVKSEIPVLIEMEPKTVRWLIGGKAEPQTIHIKMNGEKPIHVLSVTGADAFASELKTIEDGRKYELIVTPRSVDATKFGVFRLETDCGYAKHATPQAFALVQKSLPTVKK